MVTVATLHAAIGRRVKEARQRLGITQAELADRLDMEEQSVRSIESGRRGLSMESLHRVAHALRVPAPTLVGAVDGDASSVIGREIAELVSSMSQKWQRTTLKIVREIHRQQREDRGTK